MRRIGGFGGCGKGVCFNVNVNVNGLCYRLVALFRCTTNLVNLFHLGTSLSGRVLLRATKLLGMPHRQIETKKAKQLVEEISTTMRQALLSTALDLLL